MHNKKPLLVLVLLLFASMACYSDSPLWVFGVTDTPPTATFLPTPDQEQYPSKVTVEQRALAPQPTAREDPFFFITNLPADLMTGVRNASGSCEYGDELEVLYIGHQWENYTGSIYVDDIALAGADAAEVLFDFETDADWTLVNDGIGVEDDTLSVSRDVDFQRNRDPEQPDLDVSNPGGVLQLDLVFQSDDWVAAIANTFDTPQDWSTQESVTARLFAPFSAKHFVATVFVQLGDSTDVVELGEVDLTPGQWSEVSVDLAGTEGLDAVTALGFEIGPDPARTWYLVECFGNVGWASEDRIAGPVLFSRGQSALTRDISQNNTQILAGQPFGAFGGIEPPISTALPPSTQCQVNEVVEIRNVSSVDQEIWYEIGCTSGTGWVRGFRLFGPLPLPADGGNGIIRPEFETVDLTESPGPSTAENPVVGTCASNQIIRTVGFDTVEGAEERVPYYRIACEDVTGWVEQDPLIEIPYLLGTPTLVVGVSRDSVQLEAPAEEEGAEATEDEPVDDTTAEEESDFLPVLLAEEATIANADNTVGECPSGAIVTLEQVAGSPNFDAIFYQVTCEDINGWIEARFLPNRVIYEVGTVVYFTEENTNPVNPQQGFELDETPSQVAEAIGICPLFAPAEVIDIAFEQRALASLGYRLYYQLRCINPEAEEDSQEVEGWVELERIQDLTLRNPLYFLGN